MKASENYISSEPLDLYQSYSLLKADGLKYVAEVSGNNWSNFNDTDPGITILDQLCFALTELAYCIDFPIEDILTSTEGILTMKNQFFAPDRIFTVSPVTATDYVKYIVDAMYDVHNAVFKPGMFGSNRGYLLVSDSDYSEEQVRSFGLAYLNKARNLGEQFITPFVFKKRPVVVQATVDIKGDISASVVFNSIQTSLRDFIFPYLMQKGYQQMIDEGYLPEDIFQGPRLQNGWIPLNEDVEKKDKIHLDDVLQVILNVENVSYAEAEFQGKDKGLKSVSVSFDELISFVFTDENQNLITITRNGKKEHINNNQISSLQLKERTTLESVSAAVQIAPPITNGTFRNIEEYYSVQNTFPEMYKIGPHSLNASSTEFEIARSRQLKGYLSLFDQVLANEFSQLAHVTNLFSFENSTTGNFKDQRNYYNAQSRLDLKQNVVKNEYPVPYRAFAPTYFYQSLYNVPHIRPLLTGNEMFRFSIPDVSEKELEEQSWRRYQHDPYNPYMEGLSEITEQVDEGLERRGEMLDHLLARHGVSPEYLEPIIRNVKWTSEEVKNKIIVKSLYLQNLEGLSYNKLKGANFSEAMRLCALDEQFPKVDDNGKQINAIDAIEKKIREEVGQYFIDGYFNNEFVDKKHELESIEYSNYSGIELELYILFALEHAYKTEILNWIQQRELLLERAEKMKKKDQEGEKDPQTGVESTPISHPSPYQQLLKQIAELEDKIKQCYWLIDERKGMILIENQLVFQRPTTQIQVRIRLKDQLTGGWKLGAQIETNFDTYVQLLYHAKMETISSGSGDKLKIRQGSYLLEDQENNWNSDEFTPMKQASNMLIAMRIKEEGASEFHPIPQDQLDTYTGVKFYLPSYLPLFSDLTKEDGSTETNPSVADLKYALSSSLPIHLNHTVEFLDVADMRSKIEEYTKMHNAMLPPDPTDPMLNDGVMNKLMENEKKEGTNGKDTSGDEEVKGTD